MRVVLHDRVNGLGNRGDVVDVSDGYARNYLIPQGFAVAWSKGGEKQVESIRAARTARELATIEEAQDLKMKLENATIQLSVKAGKDGRLFGSVRPGDVADAVQAQGVGSLDKRKVEVPATIKTVGDHEATVRLREDITAVISLKVVAAK